MVSGSALDVDVPVESPDSDVMIFPWVPNGAMIEDGRADFGDTGPYFGTVTIQNLESERIDIFYTSTASDDYDSEDVSTWESQKLGANRTVTLSASDLDVPDPGSGVLVAGRIEGTTNPARIAAVQKQASDVTPLENAQTGSQHKIVGGYTGLPGHQVGTDAVLPIVQINSNWTTLVHVTNFNDTATADVSIQFNAADGAGWNINVSEEIGPGETHSINLLDLNPPAGWVGSAVISADTPIAAVAERAKNETDMLIMNVSQNPKIDGTQSAPLIFDDWFQWNTGISLVNLSGSSNEVVITYFDLDGEEMGEDTLNISGGGMSFVYSPASLDDDGDDNGGFVGSALIESEYPIVGAVDEVKYFGDDPDTGHAMSYMVETSIATAGESLAMPLVQRGDTVPSGDTTGIQIFNPTDDSVTVALWYIHQNGTVFADSPEIITLDGNEGHTAYTLDEDNMPAGFNGSAIIQVLGGEGGVSAVSNNVNYSVEHDGSASFNLIRTEMAGGDIPVELIPAITLEASPDEANEDALFELTAQLVDSLDNPLPFAGVEVEFEIDADGFVNAALFEKGETDDGDESFETTTDADGKAFVDVIRDEPEGDDDWLDDGFSATITVTIDGTTTSADVTVTWVEPEDTISSASS
ncbi:MAG: hypothetical protein EA415_00840 [Sphaerobacteraceae bacterium]|nr:MAG: hypothetical protein EA415_00840 [Sphaerobacteraceae bacterium]